MVRRSQLMPWKLAGRLTDRLTSGDELVQTTGWLFNRGTQPGSTLEEFVATGTDEVGPFMAAFGLGGPANDGRATNAQTLVEIGSGIGRMTCAFTHEFGSVVACDVDTGFLERCYETVGRLGRVDRLRTSQVADGRQLNLPSDSADIAFSYLTMQHCSLDDALDLAQEAVRVTKPGGLIALNFRARSAIDPVVMTIGGVARQLYRIPGLGGLLTRNRFLTRLAWQGCRAHPDQVTGQLGASIRDATIWVNPSSKLRSADATTSTYEGVNPHHWWVVAAVNSPTR